MRREAGRSSASDRACETVVSIDRHNRTVHQSCAVVPHWQFLAPADGRWTVRLCLSIDTTVSQARSLAELRPASRRMADAIV